MRRCFAINNSLEVNKSEIQKTFVLFANIGDVQLENDERAKRNASFINKPESRVWCCSATRLVPF